MALKWLGQCWFTHKDAGLWDSFRQSDSSLSSHEYSLRLPTLSHTNTPLGYVARNSFRHYILHFLLLRLKYIGYFVFKLEDINPHPFILNTKFPIYINLSLNYPNTIPEFFSEFGYVQDFFYVPRTIQGKKQTPWTIQIVSDTSGT